MAFANSISDLNKKIAKLDPRVELVRGEGYHYFTFSDKALNAWETESVMVPYTKDLTIEEWMRHAQAFVNDMHKTYP